MAAVVKVESIEEIQMDMTPMIDCVFQLLLFFMVVTKMSQSALEALILPYATFAEPDKGNTTRMVINVLPNGTIKIQGRAYSLSELRSLVNSEVTRLDGGVQQAMDNKGSKLTVLIRTDTQTQYYHLQEVIRLLSKNGVLKIELGAAKRPT